MDISKVTAAVLTNTYKKLGYKLNDDSKGFNPNILGIRTKEVDSNTFNDWLIVWDNKGYFEKYMATTDPGVYWRVHPMNVEGVGMMVEGQYIDHYVLGLHKGEYEALVEATQVEAYRDNDKDTKLSNKSGKKSKGKFGMNIHRANLEGYGSKLVDKWSAGCQVLANYTSRREGKVVIEWVHFLTSMRKCVPANNGKFTYTLICEVDLVIDDNIPRVHA
jgi:hypothetical protein